MLEEPPTGGRLADLVLATGNRSKVAEFARLFAGLPARVRQLAEFPPLPTVPESGDTYAANALAKARAAAAHTACAAVADDSGVEVLALDGFPGVRSARWAGEGVPEGELPRLLLMRMAGIGDRRARMRAAVAVALPDGQEAVAEGAVEGFIATAPKGTGGFGYDPIFLLPDGRTLAELSPAEKDRIGPRGKAVRALLPRLGELLRHSRI